MKETDWTVDDDSTARIFHFFQKGFVSCETKIISVLPDTMSLHRGWTHREVNSEREREAEEKEPRRR
jgi:hypothetical protein